MTTIYLKDLRNLKELATELIKNGYIKDDVKKKNCKKSFKKIKKGNKQ